MRDFCIYEYLNLGIRIYSDSRWMRLMDINIIASEDCMSVGDALRDIEAKSLIHNDFILVNADVVANVDMQPLIEVHK